MWHVEEEEEEAAWPFLWSFRINKGLERVPRLVAGSWPFLRGI